MSIEIRLKALEKRLERGKLSPCVSLILPEENGWRLKFSLWDGIIGSGGKTIESIHSTEEAAHAEYDRLLARYHSKDAPLIIIDI
jgi:hypothetical protein